MISLKRDWFVCCFSSPPILDWWGQKQNHHQSFFHSERFLFIWLWTLYEICMAFLRRFHTNIFGSIRDWSLLPWPRGVYLACSAMSSRETLFMHYINEINGDFFDIYHYDMLDFFPVKQILSEISISEECIIFEYNLLKGFFSSR